MIDAHCHIDQYTNPQEIAKKAEQSGIITIAVTSLPEHFKLGYFHLKQFKRVRLALGYHPMLAGHEEFDENLFKSLALKTSYIGEVGLDFSDRDYSKRQQQIDILQRILRAINDRPRLLSLHSRGAERDLLNLLNDNGIENAVFHWYSGPLRLIDEMISMGHYFSINPAMIRSKKGKRTIERIPLNRILTETDGPYVKVKGRPAEPEDVKVILNYLQGIWNKSFEEIEGRININFRGLISRVKGTTSAEGRGGPR